MTSSSKKKKRRRADFHKVKLKVGKKIPKSLNETKTTFKAKKIQILNQFEPQTSSQVKPKINLEDFFHKIKNRNNSIRKDALIHFKELLNTSPEVVYVRLKDVIIQLSKLMEDQMSEIRTVMHGVLKKLLLSISKDQLYPNFHIIIGYLNCAMTHLDADIQEHSLNILDFLIEHFPHCLVSSHKQILSNFLEQISHRSTSPKNNTSKNFFIKRTLTVNPNQKITSEIWRLRVFKRLQKFLKSLLKILIDAPETCEPVSEINWTPTTQLYVDPNSLNMSSYTCQDFYCSKSCSEYKLEKDDDLQNFVVSITPLLFETWKELCPSKKTEKVINISSHLLQYLNCLMEIMNTVISYIDYVDRTRPNMNLKSWYQKTYETDFIQHFAQFFPYVCDSTITKNRERKKDKNIGVIMEVSCDNVNLLICYIFVQLTTDINSENEIIWDTVLNFITELISKETNSNGSFNMNIIISILRRIIENKKVDKVKIAMLEKIFPYYRLMISGSVNKKHLDDFFCQYLRHIHEDKSIISSSEFTLWAMSLPKEIHTGETSWEMITIMRKLGPLKNEAFLSALRREMSSIIEKLVLLKIPKVESNQIQRSLLELLLWVPYLDSSDFLVISRFLKSESLSVQIQQYCLQILNNRYCINPQKFQSEASSFISFMLHLLLGFHSHELAELKPVKNSSRRLSFIVTMEKSLSGQKWEQHKTLIKEICNGFNVFENVEQIKVVISAYLDKLFKKHKIYPLSLVKSLFELLGTLQPMHDFFILSSVKKSVAELAVAAMVTENIHAIDFSENVYRNLFSYFALSDEVFQLLSEIVQNVQTANGAVIFCQVFYKFIQVRKLSPSEVISVKNKLNRIQKLFRSTIEDSENWHSLQYHLDISTPLQEMLT